LSNDLLKGKISLKTVVTKRDKEPHGRTNYAISDSNRIIPVEYRFVFELLLNNSLKVPFGIDADVKGNILYKYEVPLLYEKEFPVLIDSLQAKQKALAAKKIKSRPASLVYSPLASKLQWIFIEILDNPDQPTFAYIVVDAVTGEATVTMIERETGPVLEKVRVID
jgi:hypothetical protein